MQWSCVKYIDGFQYVPVTYPLSKPDGILIENLRLEQLIQYINTKKIKKAFITGMGSFDYLARCPDLEHICIEFQLTLHDYKTLSPKGNKYLKVYDLDSLYKLPNIKSINIINNENPDIIAKTQIDVSRLHYLEYYYGDYGFIINLEMAYSLKSIILNKYSEYDLGKLSQLKKLDTIQLTFSKLQSLNGCEAFQNLQCFYLYNNRSLVDISALRNVKDTLKALRIENCSKIEDFSILSELKNLEFLDLSGSNTLPSLEFITSMKKLKTFIFSMNVSDGDLSPCLDLSYVYCEKNRKHYNIKDSAFPRLLYIKGNEGIEEWRRLQ